MGLNKMEFHTSAKLLEDPNVIIGDTGANIKELMRVIAF